MTTLTKALATDWLNSWDLQQEAYLPDRSFRFKVITKAIESMKFTSPVILDLGCGPGSLSKEILAAIPDAKILAIDQDPLLLKLGRTAIPDSRIEFLEKDLRESDWASSLEIPKKVDAVISSTALHWLEDAELITLYKTLSRLIRRGGIFLDADDFPFSTKGALANIAKKLATPDLKDDLWDNWWKRALASPLFKEEALKKESLGLDHHHEESRLSAKAHLALLESLGFSETSVLWQQGAGYVIAAIR